MAQSTKKTIIVNGTPYIGAVGVNALESLGNTAKLTAVVNFDKKTSPNFQGGGGNNKVFQRFKDGTVTLDCRETSVLLLEIALGGTAETIAASAVADEAHTVVALDKLIQLDHMQDMSIPLVVSPAAGGTAYVEGTDYLRKRAGIIPLTGGAIAAAAEIECAYTKHKHARIQALMKTVTEKGLLFDGRDEVEGAPFLVKFHRIGFGPTKTLEFIGEDFVNWTIEGEILAYEGITDPAASQFYETKIGGL